MDAGASCGGIAASLLTLDTKGSHMNSLLKQVTPGVTVMIRMDHTHVLATFHRYHTDSPAHTKRSIVRLICTALEVHAQLEEEIFYPAMRTLASDSALVDKSLPEH